MGLAVCRRVSFVEDHNQTRGQVLKREVTPETDRISRVR